MKFKIYFDEKKSKLSINVNDLYSRSTESVIFGTVFSYQLERKFESEIKDYLSEFLTEEHNKKCSELDKKIRDAQQERNKYISDLRSVLYPKMLEKCENFKTDFPELFI